MIRRAGEAERVEMETTELDRAESEAEHAGDQFEEAIFRLKDAVTHSTRPEIEAFVRKRFDGIRKDATRILSEDPLTGWSIVFAAGLLAGVWVTSFPRKGSPRDQG
jgi:hypothetical protein